MTNTDGIHHKSYIPINKDVLSIMKLEQRVESLEHLNDQLFNSINFLVENLPELVITILQNELDEQNSFGKEQDETEKDCAGVLSTGARKNEDPYPTRRERDVLELLMKGLCAKEIAIRLFISETTVITHKKNLKNKFQVKNTVELVSKANNILLKVKKK
jgi:DNA-binding CsgD family transcriptional regulator